MFEWFHNRRVIRDTKAVVKDSGVGTDVAGEAVEPEIRWRGTNKYMEWKRRRRMFSGCAVPRRRYEE